MSDCQAGTIMCMFFTSSEVSVVVLFYLTYYSSVLIAPALAGF